MKPPRNFSRQIVSDAIPHVRHGPQERAVHTTGTNLPKSVRRHGAVFPIHTIHQTGAVRMINFEFRQRTDESALLEKGFLPVSARSDLLPESGRRFRSDEVRLRPQDSDTVPGNVFFISRRGGTHPTPTIRPARQVKSDSVAAGHGTICRRVVFVNIRKPAAPKRTNDRKPAVPSRRHACGRLPRSRHKTGRKR